MTEWLCGSQKKLKYLLFPYRSSLPTPSYVRGWIVSKCSVARCFHSSVLLNPHSVIMTLNFILLSRMCSSSLMFRFAVSLALDSRIWEKAIINLYEALPKIERTCFCLSQLCFQQCHEKDMPFIAQECREELFQVNLMFKALKLPKQF